MSLQISFYNFLFSVISNENLLSLEKLVGDGYRPFFAYDLKDASMDYPVDLYDSSDVHTQLYLLALGITRNDCAEPCTSTFVQSSLRFFSR